MPYLRPRISIVFITAAYMLGAAASQIAFAGECWIVSNLKGYAAYADGAYAFSEDVNTATTICFEQDKGTVSGTDTPLVKFGDSTLIGYATRVGIELVEVYQLDRVNRKLLYAKTRIGTKTVLPVLSDTVGAFVGDVTQLPE